MNARVFDLLTRREQALTPEHRAHLMQRVVDLDIEITLLTAERDRLRSIAIGGVALSTETDA